MKTTSNKKHPQAQTLAETLQIERDNAKRILGPKAYKFACLVYTMHKQYLI